MTYFIQQLNFPKSKRQAMENKEMLRKLAEEKLNAFAIGNMGKSLASKRKLKEQRQREDEEAIGHAFQEFFKTFQEPETTNTKTWVKGGTFNPDNHREDLKEKGRFYTPNPSTSVVKPGSNVDRLRECAKLLSGDNMEKRNRSMKKSNLEQLKEELKQSQEERDEKNKVKGMITKISECDFETMLQKEMGGFGEFDLTTTNLYIGNLHPSFSEVQLMEMFGKYGPLANVKIIRPHLENSIRSYFSGFVTFMNRNDAERALRNLNGTEIMGHELKVTWGKAVLLPSLPIYVPPAFHQLMLPPKYSGLPFNAQPVNTDNPPLDQITEQEFTQLLANSVVRVVIPTDRKTVALIHRMIEFVVREGPLFEAMMMKKELHNPMYSFLFDNCSHQHIYYRWKLFSILQGDTAAKWRTDDFRMFANGSIWRPPPMNIYTRGMPEHLIDPKDPAKSLSSTQRERFDHILENLCLERLSIGEAMIFALQHGNASEEICTMILETVKSSKDPKLTIACLYLVSDILSQANNTSYRRAIETRVIEMFNHISTQLKAQVDPEVTTSLKSRIGMVIDAWKKLAVYSVPFVLRLENIFGEGLRLEDVSDDSEDGVPFDGLNFEDILSSPSPPSSPEDGRPLTIHIPSKWDKE